MKDDELFELCKQVYEATGWGNDPENHDWTDDEWEEDPLLVKYHRTHFLSGRIPYYTSDYLLEKLPKSIEEFGGDSFSLSLGYTPDGKTSVASYANGSVDRVYYDPKQICKAETPLKALLKLTISLHEAGELKEDK